MNRTSITAADDNIQTTTLLQFQQNLSGGDKKPEAAASNSKMSRRNNDCCCDVAAGRAKDLMKKVPPCTGKSHKPPCWCSMFSTSRCLRSDKYILIHDGEGGVDCAILIWIHHALTCNIYSFWLPTVVEFSREGVTKLFQKSLEGCSLDTFPHMAKE